ncbi:anti-sigma factor [Trinickia fusca]|uniref:Anti-sigma K factor RskA C-terminal domain-containing protein n=1 Tax=Trinickia fusca TaxID=2419777 RepID=A0A494X3C0_9BURK|nr:anti-sigma factor [Trinickia fusca]RKP44862.1 hypothetical protein D7S89_21145 [Trinickia fusca]
MNLHRHPDLIDRLASQYALGVLRGGARRRLERIAQTDSAVRAAIDTWQQRLAALPELAPPVIPPATTWHAIEHRLGLTERHAPAQATAPRERAPSRERVRWFDNLAFWRNWSIGATGAALAAAVALAVTLGPWSGQTLAPLPPTGEQTAAQQPPSGTTSVERVAYVAALADRQTDKTMVFVMWDDKNAMLSVHRMMGGDAAPAGKSEQLWGIPEHGNPVSLGMLPPGKVVSMKVHGMAAFVKLAVSVEPEGGSTSATGPSGPVVCSGRLMATA